MTSNGNTNRRGESHTTHERFDHPTAPSTAVVQAVCDFKACAPEALPLLHQAINTDALDALFEGDDDRWAERNTSVAFDYAAVHVTVDRTDRLDVTVEATGDAGPTAE